MSQSPSPKRLLPLVIFFLIATTITSGIEDLNSKMQLPGFLYDLKKAKPMNGIDPAAHLDFWNTWPLVNVRYRKDNGEQRFVYANELAFKSLNDGVKEFPEGAMFAKVAFAMVADPSFPNSMQPHRVTRVQYMRRNRKDYASTDGWGYALYVPNSKAGNIDKGAEDITDQQVCHGCHTLAKERNFIFSKYAFDLKGFSSNMPIVQEGIFKSKFEKKNVAQLSNYGQKIIANLKLTKPFKSLKVFSMPLFAGALHESIGPLGEFVLQDNEPYMILDDQRKEFLIIYPQDSTKECPHNARVVMPLLVLPKNERLWHFGNFCDGKNSWANSTPVPADVSAVEANTASH